MVLGQSSSSAINCCCDAFSSFLWEVHCFERNTLTCNGDDIATQRTDFQFAIGFATALCPDPCADLDCGDNGECEATDIGVGACRCFEGWSGDRCDRRKIDAKFLTCILSLLHEVFELLLKYCYVG